jgi:sensor domain CHASE-containing protein
MCYLTHRLELRNEQREVSLIVRNVNENMYQQLEFSRMAAFSMQQIIDAKGNIGQFDSLATIIMQQSDYLDAVQLVPDGVITHVHPLEGNEAVIGYDILSDKKVNQEALRAIAKKSMYFAGPFELKQGGMGVVGRLPVFIKGKVWGFTAVIIRLERLLRNAGIQNSPNCDYVFQFSKDDPNTGIEQFFLPNVDVVDMKDKAYQITELPQGDWRIYVLPTDKMRVYQSAIILLILGGIMSFMISVFVRHILRSSSALENTHRKLELQHNDIQDGIRNAKYLQQTVLHTLNDLQAVFPESFVIMRPRNVVSGDFYWSYKKGNVHYLAVVDCTGHGVSGALLSMIGLQFLNQIVVQDGETSPATILQRMDSQVSSLLMKESSRSSTDGMDMILIRYDNKAKEVVYAGAQRPLYYSSLGSLTELPGNKFAIGGHEIGGMAKEFTETTISVTRGSMVYLTSDGFHSQFGGAAGRKLGRSRLRTLFEEAATLPIDRQFDRLNREFDDWKGNVDQVDDVLVVGVKL